jgi:hypothetical protein
MGFGIILFMAVLQNHCRSRRRMSMKIISGRQGVPGFAIVFPPPLRLDENLSLPAQTGLNLLKAQRPRQYELAEIVGKWIWLSDAGRHAALRGARQSRPREAAMDCACRKYFSGDKKSKPG